MESVLTFAENHWFLAWMAIWGGSWLAIVIVSATFEFVTEVITQAFKSLSVIFRGWPPSHIDIDE